MLTFVKLEHDLMLLLFNFNLKMMFFSKKFSSYSEVSAPQHPRGTVGVAHTDAREWLCIYFFSTCKSFF